MDFPLPKDIQWPPAADRVFGAGGTQALVEAATRAAAAAAAATASSTAAADVAGKLEAAAAARRAALAAAGGAAGLLAAAGPAARAAGRRADRESGGETNRRRPRSNSAAREGTDGTRRRRTDGGALPAAPQVRPPPGRQPPQPPRAVNPPPPPQPPRAVNPAQQAANPQPQPHNFQALGQNEADWTSNKSGYTGSMIRSNNDSNSPTTLLAKEFKAAFIKAMKSMESMTITTDTENSIATDRATWKGTRGELAARFKDSVKVFWLLGVVLYGGERTSPCFRMLAHFTAGDGSSAVYLISVRACETPQGKLPPNVSGPPLRDTISGSKYRRICYIFRSTAIILASSGRQLTQKLGSQCRLHLAIGPGRPYESPTAWYWLPTASADPVKAAHSGIESSSAGNTFLEGAFFVT